MALPAVPLNTHICSKQAPFLYPPCTGYRPPQAVHHELPDFVDEIARLAVRLYAKEEGVLHDPDLLAATTKTLLEGVYEGYGQNFTSVDWFTPDSEMLTRITQNVFSFSAAKNYQQLRTMTEAMIDHEGKIRSFVDFKEQVGVINEKFNRNWLQTEYDTCIATATQSARWQEFQAQKHIMPYLRYQTAGDDSVRDEHRLLDGVIKHIDDPFWRTYYPPNGWNCRCEAVQVTDDNVSETPDKAIRGVHIAPMFRTNSGQTGLIFPKGHPYFDGVPNAEIRQAIAYLPAENGYIDRHIVIESKRIPIEQHVMHGVCELNGNIEVLSDLLHINPRITQARLLPEINAKDADLKPKFYPKGWKSHDMAKNADAVLEFQDGTQWVVDFKRLEGKGGRLGNHLGKAALQADYAIVKLSDEQKYGINSIRRSIEDKLKSTELKGVIIIDNKGRLLYEQYKNTTAN